MVPRIYQIPAHKLVMLFKRITALITG